MTQSAAEIAKMPFEAALAELESIVDKLEKGSVALEDSIKLYERGESLKKHCDDLLKNGVAGIHLYTMNRALASTQITKGLRSLGHFPVANLARSQNKNGNTPE